MGERVAFLGLGVMGGPMAAHLARAGHDVSVFNRTRARADAWVAANDGRAAASPAEAAREASFVFCCVGNDDDLRAVTLDPEGGAFASMQPGAVFIDHTTVSARIARELAEVAAARGLGFLDAPVSGGQAGAEKGALTVMVGGDSASFARAAPLIDVYSVRVRRLGDAGTGQLTKMVNQICIAGVLQALSEGLHFAKAAGLDPNAVVEVISKGAAQSWQMENRHETMARGEFDFGFAVDWMRKDLGIALDEARSNGAKLPVATLVDQFYAHIQARGGGRWDTSSLIALLEASDEA